MSWRKHTKAPHKFKPSLIPQNKAPLLFFRQKTFCTHTDPTPRVHIRTLIAEGMITTEATTRVATSTSFACRTSFRGDTSASEASRWSAIGGYGNTDITHGCMRWKFLQKEPKGLKPNLHVGTWPSMATLC